MKESCKGKKQSKSLNQFILKEKAEIAFQYIEGKHRGKINLTFIGIFFFSPKQSKTSFIPWHILVRTMTFQGKGTPYNRKK